MAQNPTSIISESRHLQEFDDQLRQNKERTEIEAQNKNGQSGQHAG
jgi:hypothetical protein